MKKPLIINKSRLGVSLLTALTIAAAGSSAYAQENSYQQHNLVADIAGTADVTDPNLVNPWGVAFNPFGKAWVANNGTGVSTAYSGIGTPNSRVVQIPTLNASTGGHPTGVVFNNSLSEFVISSSGASGTNGTTGTNGTSGTGEASARLIFATEEGVIAAWAPSVDPTHAIRIISGSTSGGTTSNAAVYKGLAISANGTGSWLYATDFRNNRVDVFNNQFQRVNLATGAFNDQSLPQGFAPYGIQEINGSIYVSYAMQDENQQNEVKGEGLGFVNVFSPSGEFIKRIVSEGNLNAPWGMALAPAGFGEFGSRLLIGNFGDGTINAYDVATGELIGQLSDTNGSPIQIDGLWALAFGNGFANQPVNTLFFTAGPNDEQNGLYGRIDTPISVTGQGGTTGVTTGTSGTTGTTGI